MLRWGIVQVQDFALGRVRVTFPALDQVQSYWLQVLQPRASKDHGFDLPDIGDRVACLMDEHDEAGVVLGAYYSQANPAPFGMTADKTHRDFFDGTVIEYDRAAHVLKVSLAAGATLQIAQAAGGAVNLDAQGNAVVSGTTVKLGTGTVKGVARLGDQVTCPAGTGTITSASAVVSAE